MFLILSLNMPLTSNYTINLLKVGMNKQFLIFPRLQTAYDLSVSVGLVSWKKKLPSLSIPNFYLN